jgi:hypothetical protein
MENSTNIPERSYEEIEEILEKNYSKEVKKYYKAMSYQMMAVEVYALYHVLVLETPSEDELTRRHEANVRRILNIK